MVVVKIELIENPDMLDNRPYKIVRVHDNGVKHLLTTERIRKSAVRTATRLAQQAGVSLEICSSKLQKTERRLQRRYA